MTAKVWFRCPRCRLDLGTPVRDDDHHRICLFCGKQWRDPEPTTLPMSQRVDRPEWAR